MSLCIFSSSVSFSIASFFSPCSKETSLRAVRLWANAFCKRNRISDHGARKEKDKKGEGDEEKGHHEDGEGLSDSSFASHDCPGLVAQVPLHFRSAGCTAAPPTQLAWIAAAAPVAHACAGPDAFPRAGAAYAQSQQRHNQCSTRVKRAHLNSHT